MVYRASDLTGRLPQRQQIFKRFRLATLSDVPFILGLLCPFYDQHRETYCGIEYDRPSAVATIESVITSGVCLVGQKSVAGFTIQPFPWNNTALIAFINFWKVKGHREMAIFEALRACAKEAGATHIAGCAQFPLCTIGRFYEKAGLLPCEKQFIGLL